MPVHDSVIRIFCLSFIIFLTLPVPCQSEGNAATCGEGYELVWSQSDGLRYEIFSSSCREKTWTAPAKITDNNANNLHPVIDVAPDGTKWFFWSAVRPNGISVEYATSKGNEWSEPESFPFEQSSAITPSVLIEKNGVVWLVWAGNNGGNDEIYYSRYMKKSWQKPKVLNAANDVPDIKPLIAYNEQGEIEVVWQGFRDGQYKFLSATYTLKGWTAEQETEEEDQVSLEKSGVKLPSFIPETVQYYLKIN